MLSGQIPSLGVYYFHEIGGGCIPAKICGRPEQMDVVPGFVTHPGSEGMSMCEMFIMFSLRKERRSK